MCFKKRSYLWSWCDLMAKLVPPNCTVQRLIHSSEKQSCLAMTNCSTGNSHLRPKMKTEIMVTPTVPVGAPDHRDGLHLHFTFLEDKHHICNYLQPALWYFITLTPTEINLLTESSWEGNLSFKKQIKPQPQLKAAISHIVRPFHWNFINLSNIYQVLLIFQLFKGERILFPQKSLIGGPRNITFIFSTLNGNIPPKDILNSAFPN